MKCLIDPAVNILYSSFYIIGLRRLYGFSNVCFSSEPFESLVYDKDTHTLPFVIHGKKYVIDFADSNKIIYDSFLNWADVYGKVNYNKNILDNAILSNARTKIIPIFPNCALQLYGHSKILNVVWGCYHFVLCKRRLQMSFKRYLSRYLSLSNLISIREGEKIIAVSSEKPMLFYMGTLWNGQEECNVNRANYIRACKDLQKEGIITFIGGLLPETQDMCVDKYKDVICTKKITHQTYIYNILSSAIVFNTPAYFGCHGWKLVEYLKYKKVIYSTPFINELPIPLSHNVDIYYASADSVDKIKKDILHLLSESIHAKISDGVLKYYQEYANPKSVIKEFLK